MSKVIQDEGKTKRKKDKKKGKKNTLIKDKSKETNPVKDNSQVDIEGSSTPNEISEWMIYGVHPLLIKALMEVILSFKINIQKSE